MKVEKTSKHPMELSKVRVGTVFVSGDKVYLKVRFADSEYVVDLEAGTVLNPTPEDGFRDCYIYPKAVIKLEGDRKVA